MQIKTFKTCLDLDFNCLVDSFYHVIKSRNFSYSGICIKIELTKKKTKAICIKRLKPDSW